jgi:hypothetical protein
MDSSVIRIVCVALVVLFAAVIVIRRKSHKAE